MFRVAFPKPSNPKGQEAPRRLYGESPKPLPKKAPPSSKQRPQGRTRRRRFREIRNGRPGANTRSPWKLHIDCSQPISNVTLSYLRSARPSAVD